MQIKNNKGQLIGTIKSHVFFKTVRKSRHLLRKMDAWAIDKKALDYAKDEGVDYIQITDMEEHIVYTVSMEDFLDIGIPIDFGYGSQIALPRRYWKSVKLERI